MKPDALIYERALAVAAVEPKKCLFVDDRLDNVAGARAMGVGGSCLPIGGTACT